VPPQKWGVTTRSKAGDRLYVHILDGSDEVRLPKAAGYVANPKPLHGDGKVELRTEGEDVVLLLRLPKSERDPMDTILVLDLKK
jgi:hypothetical protein